VAGKTEPLQPEKAPAEQTLFPGWQMPAQDHPLPL
jgi:hypothetical protein